MLVSLDVISLFSRVPVDKSLNYISEIFTKNLVNILQSMPNNILLCVGWRILWTDWWSSHEPTNPSYCEFLHGMLDQLYWNWHASNPIMVKNYNFSSTHQQWEQKNLNSQLKRKIYFLFLMYWYQERGMDFGTTYTQCKLIQISKQKLQPSSSSEKRNY